MKILFADDDFDQLALRCMLLERRGFETLPASDSATALALAQTQQPDCAVLDLNLPTIDCGLKLVRDLKALHPAMHLIVLTGGRAGCLKTRPELDLIDEVIEKGSGTANLLQHLTAYQLSMQPNRHM